MRVAAWAPALALVVGLAPGLEARESVTDPRGDVAPGSGALHMVDAGRVLGACPLERTEVSAEISGFVARVTVVQRFRNTADRPIEAVYTFPLSQRAAVDDMAMRAGDREIRGDIRRREDARREYEQAKARGQLAALLDQERPNVFTQSLANVMPGERVEVQIRYVEPLEYEAGTFEFAFPTVVGPRFVPGAKDGAPRVPDADRITPPVTGQGTRAGHDIAISVDIKAPVPIFGVESRLHEVDVERPTPDRARVRLRQKAEIPNRDFVLRYAVAGDEVRSGYLAHRGEAGDGYVTFVLLPPKRVAPEAVAPRELIFVIDRSGSQHGLPLLKAKETMLWILDHMNPDDTFQVVDFGNTANVLFERPERASPAMKARARAHIEALQANGGTMMAEAVQRVAAIPADGNRLRIVTFMTDGYVGNDYEVIDLVRRLRGSSRWFPFGAGNSVNRFLLEQMARQGGGEVEYVLLNQSGERVARSFHERIASPVLTDVRLEVEGLEMDGVQPLAPSDVWAERPLVIHARYRKPGRGRVVLHGFRQGKPYRQALEVDLPAREPESRAIASMWARATVDDLMQRDFRGLQTGRFPDSLKAQVVEVALAHRLVTPFTSFVAVDPRVVNPDGAPATVRVPVEMPQGVTYEGVFGPGAAGVASSGLPPTARSLQTGAPVREEAAREARQPSVPEAAAKSARREEAAADRSAGAAAPAPGLTPAVRARLAPDLVALLEGAPTSRPVTVVDGRVEVRVRVKEASAALRERLGRAGLRIRLAADGYLVGWVSLADLARLAAADGVETVLPA
jgi:Ca-activated chloride channel family protein